MKINIKERITQYILKGYTRRRIMNEMADYIEKHLF